MPPAVGNEIKVIGDEIYFGGELVAVMTTNGAPSHVANFLEALEGAPSHECATVPDYDQALSDVATAATEYAKGGLLRMSDLATIRAKLKEETE